MTIFWMISLSLAAFATGTSVGIFVMVAMKEKQHRSMLPQELSTTDFSGALAVPDTHPMWKAVHQVLDKSEREIIEAAQKMAGVNNDRALNSLSNSEGVAFIRRRLNEARDGALTRMR